MAINIKNGEAEAAARELARATGTSITQAVVTALREALLRARGRRTAPSMREAILEVSERCAALPDLDTRKADEVLAYDEHGGFA